MKSMTLAVTAILVLGHTAAYGEYKTDDNKDKLIGVWEGIEGGARGATVEFTKDGKIKISVDSEGKKKNLEGTYDLVQDAISLTMKGVDGKERKEKMKIKTLTDDKLVTEDEKGREDQFKKQEKK